MSPRLIATIAAIAMAGAALPALAKQAEPEVTLHIEASAQVEPDMVVLPLTLQGSGETKAQAEADLARRDGELMARLKAMGIDAAKAKPFDDGDESTIAVAMSPAEEAACEAAEAAASAARPPRKGRAATVVIASPCARAPREYAAKSYLIELKDGSQAEALLAEFAGERSYSARRQIQFGQSDPAAARGKARDQAIAKARAEAEAYAGSLGYRVVRIVRVSNARPGISLNEVIGFIASIDGRGSRLQPGWYAAVTTEHVAIDFVIAPK